MTIFELDNQSSICDSHQVRLVCGSPANGSWKMYRTIIGVKERARKLTLRQSFLLWVCANLYRNGMRGLTKSTLAAKANTILQSNPESIRAIAILSGSEPINGRELPEILQEVIGKKRGFSRRTLYRKCKAVKGAPTYSVQSTYNAAQIRRILKAVTA